MTDASTPQPRHIPSGHCSNCGYPIDPGTCPECGTYCEDVTTRRTKRRGFVFAVLVAISPLLTSLIACGLYGPALQWMTNGMTVGDHAIGMAAHDYSTWHLRVTLLVVLVGGMLVAWRHSRGHRKPEQRFGVLLFISLFGAVISGIIGMMMYLVRIDGI